MVLEGAVALRRQRYGLRCVGLLVFCADEALSRLRHYLAMVAPSPVIPQSTPPSFVGRAVLVRSVLTLRVGLDR